MGNLYVIIHLLAKIYFHTPFLVEGDSMLPTIAHEEIIVLDKFIYRESFPERGDIVVFSFLDEPEYFYVKRIIGLPGETIRINKNGIQIKKGSLFQKLEEEYLKNQQIHYDYEKSFQVPPGEYFVMGDNRDHSKDSRFFKDPYIAKKQILGKYTFGFTLNL